MSGRQSVKVAEHSFGSLWVYVICQIMVRGRLQLTSWNLASGKYTDERFDWQVKFDVFVVSMSSKRGMIYSGFFGQEFH